MKAKDFFDLADWLPFAEPADLLGNGGALVVAPHPDDESLGCGILIARAVAEGRRVRIVVLSDGTGSHPSSRTYPPERLRDLRESEARAAAKTLGISPSDLVFLALRDGHVPSEGPQATEATEVLVREAHAAGAGAIFVTWRLDPHCDHRAAYAIARAAQRQCSGLRLFEYSIWARDLPLDREVNTPPRGWRLSAAGQRARKRAAIDCHRSQISNLITDDPLGFRLDPAMVARLANRDEAFLELAP